MAYPFVLPETSYVGQGALQNLLPEVQRSGCKKVLIICDPGLEKAGLAYKVRKILEDGDLEVDVYSDVELEPGTKVVEKAAEYAGANAYQMIIGLGGGSSIDIAKTCAVLIKNKGKVKDLMGIENIPCPGLPTIIIPTTAGTGAEVTMNAIFTVQEEKVKKGIVSRYLLPKVAIVDPEMTLTAPPGVTAATGMDALVHAVESYTAIKATVQTDIYAEAAIYKISRHLRTAVANGNDLDARTEMSWGSYLAGISLANAGVGAVHALAYPLGGQFHIAHGVANSLLFAPVIAFNLAGNIKKFARVAQLMGEPIAGKSPRAAAQLALKAIRELAADIGIPQTLKEVGVVESDLAGLVAGTADQGRLLGNNPRRLTTADITQIYRNAL